MRAKSSRGVADRGGRSRLMPARARALAQALALAASAVSALTLAVACGAGSDGVGTADGSQRDSDGAPAPVTAPLSLRTIGDTAAVGGAADDPEDDPAADASGGTSGSTADDPASPPTSAPTSTTAPGAPPPTTGARASAPATDPTAPATSTAPAAPSPSDTRLALAPVAQIPSPVSLVAHPVTGQRYVATLNGQIWLLDPAPLADEPPGALSGALPGASSKPQLVADISELISTGCENGLLDIAFSPDGNELYLSYTEPARNSRIAVVPMDGHTPRTDRRRVLLALDQPACNHNGGDLAFGPDGYLWIAFGDGGGADDVYGHGQNPATLHATLLRIDTRPPDGRGYAIPSANPFTSTSSGAPEVWAYGARNPWRFSFDRATGDLWVGDVGQNRIEEIHVLPAARGRVPGANLGWPLFEGNERFSGSATPADLVAPVYTYSHAEGCSVTGGYVYRGSAVASLAGTYVFGDYCAGELWGLVRAPDGSAQRIDLGVSVARNSLVSFGEDAADELYVLSSAGTVYRLVLDAELPS